MTVQLNAHSSAYPPNYLANESADQTDKGEVAASSKQKRGVASASALWPQHSVIRISLMGMSKAQEEFTKANINKWAPHVNLHFEFTDAADGDIRIAADNDISGGHSYLGTRSLYVPPDKPTMVIGLKGGPNAYNAGTIQHEFGHVLGLQHEHQHENNDLDINWSEVKKTYMDKGGEKELKANFGPLVSDVVSSDYDRKSIMHYGFNSSWLNSGDAIGDNNELSEGDIHFVRSLYPPEVKKKPVSASWWDFRHVQPSP
ncbi:M12 family metallopeptidase [Pseudomonas shahriarae]|uniref:M12 family metallopeptidase n=1 Tax=Pseudomonas shahriarae TaxID=2745512 RepID=A0ABT5N6X3_9PSED|nr:M12 family metallopeptidase [Pseudomonas shahriarae]MDD0984287.1 M12 family metallopeptidase [Pseudomonas shahriarae]MDD1034298.1 M12 family metallopeptidase [Pseudomonas shahriarae]SUD44226.1 Astacin (Peptidase family M12A) [Pseudomonas fluorescens]